MGWVDDRKKDFKKAQNGQEQRKKFSDYYDLAQSLLNEDERDGTILKEVLKQSLNIAGKLLGSKGLSNHPYVAYHKTHIEALAAVINISAMHGAAQQAVAAAGKTAAHVQIVAKYADDYAARRDKLMRFYDGMMYEILRDLREFETTGTVKDRQVNGAMPADELQSLKEQVEFVAISYGQWMKDWNALVNDAFALLIMVRVEANRVEKLMSRYDQKVKSLMTQGSGFKGNVGYIGGKSLERDRQYDQIAVEYARKQKSQPGVEALAAAAKPRETIRRALERVEREAKLCASGAAIASADGAIQYPGQATAQFAYLRNGK